MSSHVKFVIELDPQKIIEDLKNEINQIKGGFEYRTLIRAKARQLLNEAIRNLNIEIPPITFTKKEMLEMLSYEIDEIKSMVAKELARMLIKKIKISIEER